MKVLVCGGRDFEDYGFLSRKLNQLNAERKFDLLIQGGNGQTETITVGPNKYEEVEIKGADLLSRRWAKTVHVPYRQFDAEWRKYGLPAGPIRNQVMVKEKPDLVIAFGGNRGTKDMIDRAKNAGIEVVYYAG